MFISGCGKKDDRAASSIISVGESSSAISTSSKEEKLPVLRDPTPASSSSESKEQQNAAFQNNTIIFGDSYSTFRGHIPENYAVYYSETTHPETGVMDVSQTWWRLVCEAANLNLVMNNSWSGSTIGYTGYNGADLSTSKSFIYRFNRLIEDGFFEKNKIDTSFILGGTNDSWSHAPIGELKFDNFKNEDFYSVLPAICYFFKTAKETLPDSDIYCLVNTYLDEKITDGMKKAAEHYGIPTIEFPVIDKWHGHPTILGMKQIADGVIDFLNK
jgi:hypothetical protein